MKITVKKREIKQKELSAKVKKLRGILKTDENFNYKKTLAEELSKKYVMTPLHLLKTIETNKQKTNS